MTSNLLAIKLLELSTDFNVSAHLCVYVYLFNIHDLLLAYAHLCIMSCYPAIGLRALQTLLPPGPLPNTTEKYLLYDSALLLLSFLPGYQIVSFSLSFNSPDEK